MKKIQFYILPFLMSFALFSCGDDEEQITIDQYIADNQLQTKVTSSGLHFIIDQEGDGNHPAVTDAVTIAYRGTLLNGTVFDSRDNSNPLTIGLNEVIQGWQEGIPLFSRGGSGTLLIPPTLAYGSQGRDIIPPNAALLFTIELIDF